MKLFKKEKKGNKRILHFFGIKISYKKEIKKRGLYASYGNNIINILNSKNNQIPKNLQIEILGQNNIVEIEMPIKFKGKNLIKIVGDNNVFNVKKSIYGIEDTEFYCCDGGSILIEENVGTNKGCYFVCSNDFDIKHKIVFGKDVHLARNTTVRTSDGHTIIDKTTNEPINEPKDVIVGNHVWIGANATLLKGATLGNNSIIATCSLVNKVFKKDNVIIAGLPAKIVKENVDWDYEDFGSYKLLQKISKEKIL